MATTQAPRPNTPNSQGSVGAGSAGSGAGGNGGMEELLPLVLQLINAEQVRGRLFVRLLVF